MATPLASGLLLCIGRTGIASVRWQNHVNRRQCSSSVCLPFVLWRSLYRILSFHDRPSIFCFTMAEAPLDASDSEAADAAAETTTGDPRSSSDWQTASLDGKDPRWQRSAIIQRLADAIAYRSGSSSTRRAPPQAYVLLRAILDRRWKQINNISNTIHNDTKQYNTIYHIINKTGEKRSRLHSSAHRERCG